jgi:multiple sugar transport system substrate-binding protein
MVSPTAPPSLPPPIKPAPGTGLNLPDDLEVKKSPFRYLIPILVVLLILGAGGLGLNWFLHRGSTPSDETITLTYWGLWEPSEVLQSVFTDFESQNPGIKINYEQQKSQDYRERLQTALSQGSGPDVFRYHHSWLTMIGPELAPIPKDILTTQNYESTFYPVTKDWLKGKNGYLGIPLEIDGLGLYYNQAIFDAAGKIPPKTWEELRLTAKQLTVLNGEQIQRGGVALGTTNNVEHWPDILGVMLLQNGADPQKPNNKNGQDALTFYTLFTTMDKVWDESMPPSSYAFATEKVAMMIAPSWRAFDVHDLNPDLKFAIAPLPQLPDTNLNWASFWVEGVNNRAAKDKQTAAWKLLLFLSQKETLRNLYASQSTVRLFGEPFSRLDMADQLTGDPYVGAYVNAAPTMKSWYMCSFTHDNGVNDQIIKYYEDAVNKVVGGEAAAKALVTAEEGINQVLTKYHATQ